MSYSLLHIAGHTIKVTIRRHTVHLITDHQLINLVKKGGQYVNDLCDEISSRFLMVNNRELRIKKSSLAIEIKGHVYAYIFLLWLRKKIPGAAKISLLKKLCDKACHVDCGEPGHDTNRWFWDVLAKFIKLFQ